jgi:hypothetical protein
MLTLTGSVRVFVCTEPADMRRSFDGLSGMAENLMKQNPLSGHLFLFRNRNRDRLKILYWDRDGLAIWYKRLEKGTWQFPTDLRRRKASVRTEPADNDDDIDGDVPAAEITSEELSLLLGGIDLRSVQRRRRYTRPNKPR